ncbi:MAG: DHA2 family efflux MFS transporter permease subunit [Geminicoccaceae bacterium]
MLIPLIVACALFMENLDSTVLATSLPSIAQSFGESPVRLSFAITSYLFSLAVFIPISGWVADRCGAKNVFRGAIVVFLTGSILCGLSNSLWQMVAARMLQGLGGAMMVPVGRLVLLRSVAKADLVSAMAWLTVPALIGPVIGPLLGGFITTYFHWRWIFWINVPIAILGLILVTLFIPAGREPPPPAFDTVGFVLTAAGLVGLMFGFETIGRDIVPSWASALLLCLGLVCMLLFVQHASRIAHPVLDLRLLGVRTFRASVTGGFLFRMGIGALPFLLPLLLQTGFGLSAFESGQLTFAAALGALTMKLVAKPILRRFGFRRVLLSNAALSGLSLAAIALFRPDTPHALILAVLLIGGFFRSLQFTSINTLGYADIDQQRMSRATSFASMAQQLSLSAGVASGAVLLHFTMVARGGASVQPRDFVPAFLGVGAMALASALVYLRLPSDAGAEVSGHLPAMAAQGHARDR